MSHTLRLLVLSFFVLFPVFAAQPDDNTWPIFHGNAQQTGIARTQLPDKLDVLWTFKTNESFENAVAVGKGIVYATSMDEHIYAIDLATGKEKWKYREPAIMMIDPKTGKAKKIEKAAPFKCAPTLRDGLVYAGDLDGTVFCLDAEKGTKKWTFEAGSEVGGLNFHNGSILLSSHDEHLYCIDGQGKLRWKFKIDGPIYGAPSVADGKTFLVGCDSQLHVIDIAKGTEQSKVDLGGQTGATAAVLGDQLYIGTMRNEVQAINWKKGEVSWTYKQGRNAQAFYATAAVTDKFVVIGSRDNRVHCIDRKTGANVWSFLTGNKVDSSPVIVGTKVVVGSLDGKLYILDLEKGTKVQEIALDGAINASPVVVDSRVIVGTQKGTLYCLGAKK